ncbi:MAG: hypothetical protein CMG00_03640, partial [Candidatus Marinimicrobia bacterium]|nr:hypothetical protein [Candidatus Neomarinimicrobiota bacterium]
MDNGNTKKIESKYYQKKINHSSHFDSIQFNWSADNLLGNGYEIHTVGYYGESILFSPNTSGNHEVTLTVKHKWTGEILGKEKYIIKSNAKETSNFNDRKEPSKIINIKSDSNPHLKTNKANSEKNQFLHCVQISSWKTRGDALVEQKKLDSIGYQSQIKKVSLNNTSWWRVRMGCFEELDEAKKISNTIYESLSKKPWIHSVLKKSKKNNTYLVNAEQKIDVENLIDYEDIEKSSSSKIDVENLIDYEDIEKSSSSKIDVENLIDYEDI